MDDSQDQGITEEPVYRIQRAPALPATGPDWNDPFWDPADLLELKHFRLEGSGHRPRTAVRLLYDANGIHGIFQVQDCYVRCLRMNYLEEVWKDSCVEFFVQPKPNRGYFNFEFNCGGAFLCYHIINPERTEDGFKEFTKIPVEVGRTIKAWASLPRRIILEITDPLAWTLRFYIPFSVFEYRLGSLGEIVGQIWRGNFYKCADESSHPHWGSWRPVDRLDFHRPSCFGKIRFADSL